MIFLKAIFIIWAVIFTCLYVNLLAVNILESIYDPNVDETKAKQNTIARLIISAIMGVLYAGAILL